MLLIGTQRLVIKNNILPFIPFLNYLNVSFRFLVFLNKSIDLTVYGSSS